MQRFKFSSTPIAYSSAALNNDIERLRNAWKSYQKSRTRVAVYRFLDQVLQMALLWASDKHFNSRSRQALIVAGCVQRDADPFRALLLVAAHPASIDDRTGSKWERVLKFAAEKKRPRVRLRKFVGRYGGINNCAAEFTRRRKLKPGDTSRSLLQRMG